MDTLEITWEMEGGVGGEDNDPGGPLSRALASLLSDRQPFVGLTQCFFADGRQQANAPILRWLEEGVKA